MVQALQSAKLAKLQSSTLTETYEEFEPLSSKRTCCSQVVELSTAMSMQALSKLELVMLFNLKI